MSNFENIETPQWKATKTILSQEAQARADEIFRRLDAGEPLPEGVEVYWLSELEAKVGLRDKPIDHSVLGAEDEQ